jgi:ADP-ribose pyrophosphatase
VSEPPADPPQVMWEGKYIRAVKQGRWEYVGRVNQVRAVVILAEYDGRTILIDQPRAAVGGRCLELPAGLIGDVDPDATVEGTAIKELEEETGFTAERIERLGDFHSSPGMVSESFTLVRAHGLRRCGAGGGTEDEEINVHLVARDDIPSFVAEKRAQGFAIDVKLLLFLQF